MSNAEATTETKEDYKGIDLSRVKAERMKAFAKEAGVKLPKDGSVEEMVAALVKHFDAQEKKGKKMLDCIPETGGCGAGSTSDIDVCPFCGLGDEAEATPGASAAPEKPTEVAAKVEEDPKKKSTRRRKDDPEPEAPKTNGKAAASAALARPVQAALEQNRVVTANEKKLNEQVAEIRQLNMASACNAWRTGQLLREILDNSSFKSRTDEKGKPVYKSLDAFLSAELNMTHAYAFRLMKVAEAYDEKTVSLYGAKKLGYLLEAPEIEREKILQEKLAKGATVAEVQSEVKAAQDRHGGKPASSRKGSSRTAAATAAAAKNKTERKAAKKKAGGEKITVAKLLERIRVPLFTAKSMKGPADSRTPVACKKVADEPVGSIELANDVIEHFSIVQDPKGNLILIVNRKRAE